MAGTRSRINSALADLASLWALDEGSLRKMFGSDLSDSMVILLRKVAEQISLERALPLLMAARKQRLSGIFGRGVSRKRQWAPLDIQQVLDFLSSKPHRVKAQDFGSNMIPKSLQRRAAVAHPLLRLHSQSGNGNDWVPSSRALQEFSYRAKVPLELSPLPIPATLSSSTEGRSLLDIDTEELEQWPALLRAEEKAHCSAKQSTPRAPAGRLGRLSSRSSVNTDDPSEALYGSKPQMRRPWDSIETMTALLNVCTPEDPSMVCLPPVERQNFPSVVFNLPVDATNVRVFLIPAKIVKSWTSLRVDLNNRCIEHCCGLKDQGEAIEAERLLKTSTSLTLPVQEFEWICTLIHPDFPLESGNMTIYLIMHNMAGISCCTSPDITAWDVALTGMKRSIDDKNNFSEQLVTHVTAIAAGISKPPSHAKTSLQSVASNTPVAILTIFISRTKFLLDRCRQAQAFCQTEIDTCRLVSHTIATSYPDLSCASEAHSVLRSAGWRAQCWQDDAKTREVHLRRRLEVLKAGLEAMRIGEELERLTEDIQSGLRLDLD